MDRLNIVAHDKFQEIIDEANRPDSPIRLQAVVLEGRELEQKTKTVVSQSRLDNMLGIKPSGISPATEIAGADEPKVFATVEEERVAQVTREVIRKLENQPQKLPSVMYLTDARHPGCRGSGSCGAVSAAAVGVGRRLQSRQILPPLWQRPASWSFSRQSTSRASSWCPKGKSGPASSLSPWS